MAKRDEFWRARHFDFGGSPLCGAKAKRSHNLTNDESEVTCKRCKHIIGKSEVR